MLRIPQRSHVESSRLSNMCLKELNPPPSFLSSGNLPLCAPTSLTSWMDFCPKGEPWLSVAWLSSLDTFCAAG
jgi:hypothetical protein